MKSMKLRQVHSAQRVHDLEGSIECVANSVETVNVEKVFNHSYGF